MGKRELGKSVEERGGLGTRQSEICPGSGKGNRSRVGVSGSERKQGLLGGIRNEGSGCFLLDGIFKN